MGKLVLGLWVIFVLGVFSKCIVGFEHFNLTELRFESLYGVSAASAASNPLVVDLTLIQGAAAQGAGTFFLSLKLAMFSLFLFDTFFLCHYGFVFVES